MIINTTTLFLYVIITVFGSNCLAQNLVLNPGFEDTSDNAIIENNTFKGVENWREPTRGGSLYLLNEACLNNLECRGFKKARTGNAAAGILLFKKTANTLGGWSYLQGRLKKPLEKGKIYQVDLYLLQADSSPIAINQIGVLFSGGTRKFDITAQYPGKPQVKNSSKKYYKNKKEWMSFSEKFVAKGGENFFTIGNFSKIENTPYLLVDKTFWKRNNITNPQLLSAKYKLEAFYFIDDISVKELPLIEENGRFRSIYFESNSSKIVDEGFNKLDELLKIKITNFSSCKLVIEGFADKQGEEKDNILLSENRAKVVADYLIQKGIPADRIEIQAYGESYSDNRTNEIDRRVDIFLKIP